jgi:hypothetical protein
MQKANAQELLVILNKSNCRVIWVFIHNVLACVLILVPLCTKVYIHFIIDHCPDSRLV